jgi:gluconate:H+ symporter, GntP family
MLEKYWLIVVLLLSIIAIIGGTSKYKIHPFLVLLGASYFVALSAGMPAGKIAGVIASGFGNLMASIGLVIVLGTLLGVVLEKSGQP